MPGFTVQRTVSAALCASLVLGPTATAHAETHITCESDHYRYRHCPIRTEGRVALVRQLSRTHCRENQTWGYDPGGIWVDQGCAAEFRVGAHSGLSRGEKVAIGAIAGLAILGAIASSKNSPARQQDVAPWAIGNFSGFDSDENTLVQVNILPSGTLNGHAAGNSFSGHVHGDRMDAGRHSFRISPQGNGLLAIDDRDGNHRVYFQRTGGGY